MWPVCGRCAAATEIGLESKRTAELGTALAPPSIVDGKGRWRLAIRAVVVTTRSSVRSHRTWGKHELEREAVDRGLELLDELEGRLPRDSELLEEHAEARRSLEQMRDEAPPGAERPDSGAGGGGGSVADERPDVS